MVRFKSQASPFDKLARVSIAPDNVQLLLSAKEHHAQLLAQIATATRRIYIAALYLQDDDAGREIVDALLTAKARSPQLEICVLVDVHRARRGLIGDKACEGNAAWYRDIDRQHPGKIRFFGIAVKRKELFGVLHLKGMIFDETILYTGASINNVYLHQGEQYRYDRYCVITNAALADTMADFLDKQLINSDAVTRLDAHFKELPADFNRRVLQQQKRLAKAHYELPTGHDGNLTVMPLVGLGKRNNQLNTVIHQQIRQTREQLLMYTPYFNLPAVLKRDIRRLLRRGVAVELVVGDKAANDFYIAPDKPFSKIGLIPYLYEGMLRQFVRQHQKFIDKGQLKIALWCDPGHSFHLKGLRSDNRYHLLTGNNLNPRAWRLDIENGLLIDDRQQQLAAQFDEEHRQIMTHTTPVSHWQQLQSMNDYPPIVRKWLKRLHRTQLDKVFKRWM